MSYNSSDFPRSPAPLKRVKVKSNSFKNEVIKQEDLKDFLKLAPDGGIKYPVFGLFRTSRAQPLC